MLENNLQSKISLEQEIALLGKQIEEKRSQLEQENKIVNEKEIIKDAIADQNSKVFVDNSSDDTSDDGSYLNNISDDVSTKVSDLVDQVFKHGLGRVLKKAKDLPALELDAFHDTLTDRLYEELKTKGFVK